MDMKEANLKAKIQQNKQGVTVVLEFIKPIKGFPKKFIEVIITP